MTDTYTVINIAKDELHEFVGQDASGICEAKERVIGEDGP